MTSVCVLISFFGCCAGWLVGGVRVLRMCVVVLPGVVVVVVVVGLCGKWMNRLQ